MAIDPQLIFQVLSTPESRDVINSPIVTAIILADPANAADLVPALQEEDTLAARNARRILCQFGSTATPHLMGALQTATTHAKKEGIEIVWAMLLGENSWTLRDTLERITAELLNFLDDKTLLPDTLPDYIERDFHEARLCDWTYTIVQHMLRQDYDPSWFRALDHEERDQEIAQLKRRGFQPAMV